MGQPVELDFHMKIDMLPISKIDNASSILFYKYIMLNYRTLKIHTSELDQTQSQSKLEAMN